jgi:hypothetical protein
MPAIRTVRPVRPSRTGVNADMELPDRTLIEQRRMTGHKRAEADEVPPHVAPAGHAARRDREARAAYGDIHTRDKQLKQSITEIRRGQVKVERRIEADARARIRDFRKQASAQLTVLQSRRREAARTLKRLSTSTGESWREIKQASDSMLGDARATATSVIERFRRALET